MNQFWEAARHAFETWLFSSADFLCNYCQIQYPSDALLFSHVESVHKVSKGKYTADNPNFLVSVDSTECQACGQCVGRIDVHLKEAHNNMKMEEYFMRFTFTDVLFEPKFVSIGDEAGSSAERRRKSEHEVIREDLPGHGKTQEYIIVDQDIGLSNETKLNASNSNVGYSSILIDSQRHFYNFAKDLGKLEHESEVDKQNRFATIKDPVETKRHFCDVCQYTTNRISNLKDHRRVHTGEKPFQCPTCFKCFSLTQNLTKHLRKCDRN